MLSSLGHRSPSCLCPRLLVCSALSGHSCCALLFPPLTSRGSGSLLGFNYSFPEGLSAHHRAPAGCRWEGDRACGEEPRLLGMAAVPSGQPTLLGLHFPEQNMSRSHFAGSDNRRGNTCSKREEKGERAVPPGWRTGSGSPGGSACSRTPGSTLHLLDND